MANIKELRGRIKSVGNIAQITRAMEMVASMKLRKVQGKALANRPYTQEIRELIQHVDEFISIDANIPLFKKRKQPKATGILVLTSDRGLCGSYNANVMAKTHEVVDRITALDPKRQIKFFCYGKKGYTYLARRGFQIERFFVEPPIDKADFRAAKVVATELVKAFEAGVVDELLIVNTAFLSQAKYQARAEPFLPVTNIAIGDAARGSPKGKVDYLLEPDPVTIFNALIPRYLEIVVFDAILQSLASEHASRRFAMKNATDAASRMTRELKRKYNRVRQESITKELLDIIGGANAVS